jgi:hypothetical protein
MGGDGRKDVEEAERDVEEQGRKERLHGHEN